MAQVHAELVLEEDSVVYTGNPFWYLTPKQIKRYNPISIDAAVEERMHLQRIAEEERLAINYF